MKVSNRNIPKQIYTKNLVKRRQTIHLCTNEAIVKEAYNGSASKRAVAKKYNVQPSQIRRWKVAIEKLREQVAMEVENHTSEFYPAKSIKKILKTKRRVSFEKNGHEVYIQQYKNQLHLQF